MSAPPGKLDRVTPPSFGEGSRVASRTGARVIRNSGHPIGSAGRGIGQVIGEFIYRGSATGIDASRAAACQLRHSCFRVATNERYRRERYSAWTAVRFNRDQIFANSVPDTQPIQFNSLES